MTARVLGILLMIGVFAPGAVFGAGLVRTHTPGDRRRRPRLPIA